MFLDASAIVALLLREPGYLELEGRLKMFDGDLHYSQLARYEATTGIARAKSPSSTKRPALDPGQIAEARIAVDEFLAEIGATEVEIGDAVGSLAIDAAMRFGKNTGHPAALNMGDCFAYACAKANGIPLLYKGDDFSQTDMG